MDFGQIAKTDEQTDTEWISLRSIMAETRSDAPPFTGVASFTFSRVKFTTRDDGSQVITLMNDGQAASVWVTQHPDAQFPVADDQTDGARLGRALQRAFGGTSNDEIQDNANALGGVLNVNQVQYGEDENRWAWLWQVKTN